MRAAPERKYAVAAATVDADGAFCGYASLFGRIDLGGDVVEAGAFARSLRRRGLPGVGLLLEHDPRAPVGSWIRLEEDARGLWVEGRLVPSGHGGRALRAMREGTLDGLSIGFSTVRAERSAGLRRLTEIDLWEVSLVESPMLPEARARMAGADRAVLGGAASDAAVAAGLIATMRRATALLCQTR